jgi:DnaJ-class molecular chaperone
MSSCLLQEHYKVLGVRPGVEAEQLKAAYKAQSLRCHPDCEGGSAEKFQRVGEAYTAITKQISDERWGTSNSAYGGTQETLLLTEER